MPVRHCLVRLVHFLPAQALRCVNLAHRAFFVGQQGLPRQYSATAATIAPAVQQMLHFCHVHLLLIARQVRPMRRLEVRALAVFTALAGLRLPVPLDLRAHQD